MRLATGAGLTLTGLGAIWIGGWLFVGFVALCVAVTVWEVSRMTLAQAPILVAGTAGGCFLLVAALPPGWGLPLLMLPVLVSLGRIGRARLAHAVFVALIVLAGYGLVHLRQDFGTLWLIWLVMVVALTDVFGYFAGRLIGGPKFWPRVSPKKTWSGTVAGWIASGVFGAGLVLAGVAAPPIVAISVAISMASQFGDIAESALKRRVGVKDSSSLLPGHGGFFDRFDGVLGAAVFLLLVERMVDFPPLPGL